MRHDDAEYPRRAPLYVPRRCRAGQVVSLGVQLT
jgi:hypothetical protein